MTETQSAAQRAPRSLDAAGRVEMRAARGRSRPGVRRLVRSLALLTLLVSLGRAAPAEPGAEQSAAEKPAAAVLRLKNGGHVMGRLLDSPQGDRLRWQAPAFAAPLEFVRGAIHEAQYPVSKRIGPIEAQFCFELVGGDRLYGTLSALDERSATLDVPEYGRLRLERDLLQRMIRWNEVEFILIGPTGLDGWKWPSGTQHWREQSGQLITDEPGAKIWRDCNAPAQACFELSMSWPGEKPDFEIDFGYDLEFESAKPGPAQDGAADAAGGALVAPAAQNAQAPGYRLETLDGKLFAVRETRRRADLAPLRSIEPSSRRIDLKVFVDQDQGRMLVCSTAGAVLADLTASDAASVAAKGSPRRPGAGFRIVNHGAGLRLERLCVSSASRVAMQDLADSTAAGRDETQLRLDSASTFDAERRELVRATPGGERRVPLDRTRVVEFATQREPAPCAICVTRRSGSRVSGELLKVEDATIWLKSPGVQGDLHAPVDDVQTVTFHEPPPPDIATSDRKEPDGAAPRRSGRLELEGVTLRGWLEDGEEGEGSCLVWRPKGSLTASPLAHGLSGRIVFQERTPVIRKRSERNNAKRAQADAGGGLRMILPAAVVNALSNVGEAPAEARSPTGPHPAMMHLRSGDAIACSVVKIDADGVTFASPAVTATFIPHDLLQAIELIPGVSPAKIVSVKKDRLLTLPRSQRDSPPTHLIRATSGDYLRGRLLAMNEREIEVESRLETKVIPRDRVARILWLRPEGGAPSDEAKAAAAAEGAAAGDAAPGPVAAPRGTLVQSAPPDGNRLTFYARRVAGPNISGQREMLGACSVQINSMDQLLIGPAVEQAAGGLAYHGWKLQPALEPRPSGSDANPNGDGEGLESSLVGKQAPDFELDLLDGKRFHLADEKNHVVVLDFWASWCGPCLQAMPQVERVGREFAGRDVRVVGVNLQEEPDRIRHALERLQLELTVALDREGLVAEKYSATSIPQTVIIDRGGKIARLFVGASPRFDEQLRTALEQTLGGPKADPAAPNPPAASK